jgi:hypothetical protein
VYSSSFEDEGEPNEKNLGPMLVGMRAYGDAWQTHQLDFRWTFPAETSFWPLLALTVLAFAAGVALGLFSGRRGT